MGLTVTPLAMHIAARIEARPSTQGDLVIWDNRCVLHRGTPYDTRRHARLLQRTMVAGDPAEPGPVF